MANETSATGPARSSVEEIIRKRLADERARLEQELEVALPPVQHFERPVERPFTRSDLVGRFLVIAATNDRSVNADVSHTANERAIVCNVADDPELCSFILPAIVRRDPIVVGVSTGGASPALAQRLRDDIAALVGPRHAELARRLADLRPWAKRTLPSYEARHDYFQKLVSEVLG